MRALAYFYLAVIPEKQGKIETLTNPLHPISFQRIGGLTAYFSAAPFEIHTGIRSVQAEKIAIKGSHIGPHTLVYKGKAKECGAKMSFSVGPLLDMVALATAEQED